VTGTAPPGLLDHRWWASDGPAGGYLLRLAIEAADPFTDDEHQVRAVTLRVLRQALPAAFTSSVAREISRRQHQARTPQPVTEPPPAALAGVHCSFVSPGGTDPETARKEQHPWFLLAIQLSALNDGYHLERHEIWSAHGNLLAAADILRRTARPGPSSWPGGRGQ